MVGPLSCLVSMGGIQFIINICTVRPTRLVRWPQGLSSRRCVVHGSWTISVVCPLKTQPQPASDSRSSISQNLWQLAVSRAVVGLGAAGLELLVLVIINGMLLYHSELITTVSDPGA
jgi:hypothetical protein